MTIERGPTFAIGILVAVGILGLAAYDAANGPVEPSVDGWPLAGSGDSCELEGAYGDPAYDVVAVASRAMGEVVAAGATVACYGEGPYLVNGQPTLINRGVDLHVVVFARPDGSRRAIGVTCVGGCRAVGGPAY